MHRTLILSIVACSILFSVFSLAAGPVASESCSPGPSPFVLAMDARASVTGSTLNAVDDLSSFCGDVTAAQDAPDVVFTLTLAQAGTFALEVSPTSSGFNPAVYVRESCATDALCFDFGTQRELILDHFAAGTYFVVVMTVTVGLGPDGATDICAGNLYAPGCWDRVLYARSECDDGATELDFSDLGAVNVESIEVPVVAGVPVFVFVDGFDAQPYSSGTFDLLIDLTE